MAKKWVSGEIITADKFNDLGIKTLSGVDISLEENKNGLQYNNSTEKFTLKYSSGRRSLWDPQYGTIRMFINHTSTIKEHENTWLLCDGREINKTTYSNLYLAIGDLYGTASSGNFKIPDLREKYIRCADSDDRVSTETGDNSHLLTVNEIPGHTHTYGREANLAPRQGTLYTRFTASSTDQPHENRPSSLCINFYICGDG